MCMLSTLNFHLLERDESLALFSRNSEKQGTVRSHLVNVMCLRGWRTCTVPRRMIYSTNEQLIDVTGVRLNVTVTGKDLRNRVTARFQRVLAVGMHTNANRKRSIAHYFKTHFSFFLLCPRLSEKSRRGSHNREL